MKVADLIIRLILTKMDEKKIITKDKLDWQYLSEKLENLYKANGAKI